MSAGTAASDFPAALAGADAAGGDPTAEAPGAAGRLLGRLSVLPGAAVCSAPGRCSPTATGCGPAPRRIRLSSPGSRLQLPEQADDHGAR